MFPDLDQSGHSEEDLFSYTDDSPDLLGDETDDVFGSLKISNSSVTPYSDATQVRTALQPYGTVVIAFFVSPGFVCTLQDLSSSWGSKFVNHLLKAETRFKPLPRTAKVSSNN